MLVSAAIDPYKKSYGNPRKSSATATGSTASERITASPRNTCVPGVHACATVGETMSTTAASAAMRRTFRHSLFGFVLDPKSFPLTTNRTPKILELGFDCLVDGFTRPTKVFGNVISIVFR